MPVLHVRKPSVSGEDDQGNEVEIPPPHMLVREGPLIQVNIGPASDLADQWRNDGREVPEPITGPALIDTGATSTCVDDGVARDLGLPVVDVAKMASASEETEQNVYPIEVDVVASDLKINSPKSIGANLRDNQDIIALIGRDVLRHTTFHYNGVTGDFTLSM
jgi:predicted aspartyl protease